jgi:hypothetical protein
MMRLINILNASIRAGKDGEVLQDGIPVSMKLTISFLSILRLNSLKIF